MIITTGIIREVKTRVDSSNLDTTTRVVFETNDLEASKSLIDLTLQAITLKVEPDESGTAPQN